MVRSNLNKLREKGQKKAYETRFSDKYLFWSLILAALLLAHYFLYAAVGRQLPVVLEILWIAVGLVALLTSTAARRLRSPRSACGNSSLRSALNRFGAFWNIHVVIVTVIMFFFYLFRDFHDLSMPKVFALAVVIAIAVCCYGIHEANTIRRVHIPIGTPKLKRGDSVRIVQLSDLHISPFMNLPHIARIVDATLDAKPDMVVITGDTVDARVGDSHEVQAYYRPFAAKLSELASESVRLGVWAVPGNHDYYEDFDNSCLFMREAGMNILITQKVSLENIELIGVDDLDHTKIVNDKGVTKSQELIEDLSEEERSRFVLLLRHRPVVEDRTAGRFDLQLSGHTHGGQIFTTPSSRHRVPGRPRGLLDVGRGSALYVSNGAGFVGPPMRFLAPAEIVIVDVVGNG